MIILTIRTDRPEAEVGLYSDHEQLAYDKWAAHRELSATIHKRIGNILKNMQLNLRDLDGVVVYAGPGSFTGLRIGVSLANALAYSLQISAVGVQGEDWTSQGIHQILSAPKDAAQSVTPEYGVPVHTTLPKK